MSDEGFTGDDERHMDDVITQFLIDENVCGGDLINTGDLMGGLFGKHRIFGKNSLFHKMVDKIR